MKQKFLKGFFALIVAVSTVVGSSVPAFAAEIEVSGDDSTTKTQAIDVTTGHISSIYSVTMPAVIELKRGVSQDTDDEGNIHTSAGYWAEVRVGAAGKILATQKLTGTLDMSDEKYYAVYGKNTGTKAYLTATVWDQGDINTSFDRFNMFHTPMIWYSNDIGTCDYDGTALTNCNYDYRTFTIGVMEERITVSDEYTGQIAINFSLSNK